MPQPTTHYLVIRRAIPREQWSDWWDQFKPYFGLGSTAPDLFYFPRISIGRTYDSEISDAIHADCSFDLFCTMLDIAKRNKINPSNPFVAEKQFAFSVGFYSHVVTDCIFHPYVYRSTHDHWNTKNFINESKHKIEEFRIDRGIHRMIYGKDQEIGTTSWKCPGGTPDFLEYAIVDLFNSALLLVYPTNFNTTKSINDDSHPIHQAYRALNSEIPYLFNGQKLFLWGSGQGLSTSDINFDDYFFTTPYPATLGLEEYTPQDLFNFACSACKKVFLDSLGFFYDEQYDSASDYFHRHPANYLAQGNWNLDTGLLCQYNNDALMQKECPEHYQYKADELKRQYFELNQLYNPEDFSA